MFPMFSAGSRIRFGRRILAALLCLSAASAQADLSAREDVLRFMEEMRQQHDFPMDQMRQWFREARVRDSILKAIARPAEKKQWHEYRPIFIQPKRIQQGVRFWLDNHEALREAQQKYQVPPEIIVAIIGVETHYGKHKGSYGVLDSLSTLAFEYPPRSAFFRSELQHYLLLTREQNMDPLRLKGSYAGAMGLPQFISSSYRRFAVDFDGDGKADIWNNRKDAIGSVANYFRAHHWKPGGKVAFPVMVRGMRYRKVLADSLRPETSVADLLAHGVILGQGQVASDQKVRLLELALRDGTQKWVTLHNFYVITRYNHSSMYAMAVFQLSEEIKRQYQKDMS